MTEFKKGDRVRVEFEGVVKDVGTHFLGVEVGGIYRSAKQSDATLLERPVEPLAPGSVVASQYGGAWFVGRESTVYVSSDGTVVQPAENGAVDLAQQLASNDYRHLTLIKDGSKK